MSTNNIAELTEQLGLAAENYFDEDFEELRENLERLIELAEAWIFEMATED